MFLRGRAPICSICWFLWCTPIVANFKLSNWAFLDTELERDGYNQLWLANANQFHHTTDDFLPANSYFSFICVRKFFCPFMLMTVMMVSPYLAFVPCSFKGSTAWVGVGVVPQALAFIKDRLSPHCQNGDQSWETPLLFTCLAHPKLLEASELLTCLSHPKFHSTFILWLCTCRPLLILFC